ncbi:MAG: hypothetical protein LBG44_07210 [Gemmatimonadota bacterium]|nr:hypothetical protein [Gemmatimonadota bacterium]
MIVNMGTVAVTPVGGATRQGQPGVADSVTFTIQNVSGVSGNFTLEPDCITAPISDCSVSPTSVALNAGQSTTAKMKYMGTIPLDTGTVRLLVSGSGGAVAGYQGIGTLSLSMQNALWAEVETVNPGTSIERSYCVAASAGEGAGYECGDLRLVHGLPATQAMSVDRAPTLLYNSQHAAPMPVVAANVWLPTGVSSTDSVTATLQVKATTATSWTTRATGSWATSGWSTGQGRRIALGFEATSNDPTGLYDYRLEVKQGANTVTRTGKLVIVNRMNSPFGAGWWLAGIERLVPEGNNLLWVGGDGSTRLFEPTTTSNPTKWKAIHPDMAGADSIRKITVGTQVSYVHDLPDKTKVYFSATGLQDSTVSRLGHSTRFQYDSYSRLSAIQLPAPAGITRQEYTVSWPAAGAMGNYTVTSPPQTGATTVSRVTMVALTTLAGGGGRIRYIQDPDSPSDTLLSTRFSYPNTTSRLVSSRTDKRGTRNSYSYTAEGNRFATVVADTGTSRLNLRTTFSPVEVVGLKVGTGVTPKRTAVVLTEAMTVINGPRTDTTVTRIWTDRWGAPTVIRDALGAETRLLREDFRFPALVTEVRAPNGYTTRAAFSTRGALIRTTQVNPYNDGRDAATVYEYADSLHPFLPTKVTQPEDDFVQMAYLANGNTSWVQDGRGSSSRVNFTYMTGSCAGLPAQVIEPTIGTQTDAITYGYDTRCNLEKQTTPSGVITTTFRNTTGRVDSIFLPIDATGRREVQRFRYDAMDRDTLTTRQGPAMGVSVTVKDTTYTGAEILTVQKRYDRGGYVTAVRALGLLRDSTEYDALGRVKKNFTYDPYKPNPNYLPTVTSYDAAGNPISVSSGGSPAVLMTYDQLDRLVRKIVPSVSFPDSPWCYSLCDTVPGIVPKPAPATMHFPFKSAGLVIPADTANFTYDAVTGTMRSATNRYSRVGRSYYPNGALRGDTLTVKGESTFRYYLGITYDRNGRRTSLGQNGVYGPQGYQYDLQTGALTVIKDIFGKSYTYSWNVRNELTQLTLPNGIAENYTYDREGRLLTRSATGGQSGVAALVGAYSYIYDQRGKVLQDSYNSKVTGYAYSGLGYLMSVGHPNEKEEFRVAPDGYVKANAYRPVNDSRHEWSYTGPGRQSGTTPRLPDCQTPECALNPFQDWDDMKLLREIRSAAGNVTDVITAGVSHDWRRTSGSPGYHLFENVTSRSRNVSWYDADQKLRFTQRAELSNYQEKTFPCTSNGQPWTCFADFSRDSDGEFVEYRYDALGRRIYTDIMRDMNACPSGVDWGCNLGVAATTDWKTGSNPCLTNCTSPKTYTVWDGDQIIYEKRTQAAAPQNILESTIEINYTHGLGIDQPLSVIRRESFPYQQAYANLVILHSGTRSIFMATDANGAKCCQNALFPGDEDMRAYLAGARYTLGESRGFHWYGSLVAGSRDQNGLIYRRNRYYNPESGQFTQIDPIGIAGGLNVYGYAAGDPINFSDPFGLDPCHPNDLTEALVCVGARVSAVEKPLEIAGMLAVAPLGGTEMLGAKMTQMTIGAKAAIATGETSVYISTAGNYVGITKNIAARAATHLRERSMSIDVIPGLSRLSRTDARAVEQVLIEHMGLSKNGGPLTNMINSISPSNPAYKNALVRGREILRTVNFPGF